MSNRPSHYADHAFMDNLFPFYILMDAELKVLNHGHSVEKSFGITKGTALLDTFEVERPFGVSNFHDIVKHRDSPFVFNYLKNSSLKLRGQVVYEPSFNHLCFLGTPLLRSLEDLELLNITFSDLPVHDSIGPHILSMQVQNSALNDLKKVAEKIQLSNARLEKINESLDTFIYKLSHDLRSPAVNINTMVQMLMSNMDLDSDSQNLTTLNYLQKSSLELLDTIKAFLSMTNIEKDNRHVHEEVVVRALINNCINTVKGKTNSDEITTRIKIDNSLKLYTVKDDLNTIFHNLLSNSIKFKSPSRPLLVIISANRLKSGAIEIIYSDNGIGIDLIKHGSKLFQMFQRFHNDSSIAGSGVGLYLVKRLVEKHQGTIKLESQLNKGTTFRIQFNHLSNE